MNRSKLSKGPLYVVGLASVVMVCMLGWVVFKPAPSTMCIEGFSYVRKDFPGGAHLLTPELKPRSSEPDDGTAKLNYPVRCGD